MQNSKTSREKYLLSLLINADKGCKMALYVLKSALAYSKTSEFKTMTRRQQDEYLLMIFELRYFLEEAQDLSRAGLIGKEVNNESSRL